MSTTLNPSIEVCIETLELDFEYRVRIRPLGGEEVTQKIRLPHGIRGSKDRRGTFDPFELGFERTGISEYVGSSPRIDLLLPDDPIARLDWEKLGRGRVFRRKPRDYLFRRSPMNGPLRVGVISTLEVKSNVYTGLTDAIAGPAAGSKVDVKLITARDWSDFSKEMRPNRFQTMHVLVQTVLTPSGPQVLIGTKLVALERFVRKVSQPGTRLVVLQDVSEDPRAIAALRWGSQSLPSDCEASLLLCSAAPSAGFFDEMKGCYESLLCDKPIDQCITHLDRELEYGRVSLVTHTGTEHALGLREELDLRLGRQRQIHADFTRLGEPSKHMTSIKIREVEPVNSNWAN